MEYAEAKGVLVYQIRKQTQTSILIDVLEAADRASLLLADLETKKAGLAQDIARLTEQRDSGIAEAQAAAEKEALKTVAQYDGHVATARGQLDLLHETMRQHTEGFERIKAEQLAHMENLKQKELTRLTDLAAWERNIQEAETQLVGIRNTIKDACLFQQAQREKWAAEQRAAEEKLVAVKQEIAALLAKLHI